MIDGYLIRKVISISVDRGGGMVQGHDTFSVDDVVTIKGGNYMTISGVHQDDQERESEHGTLTCCPRHLFMTTRFPVRTVWHIDHHKTSILWWPSTHPAPRWIVVMVPGNPGEPGFYTEYLNTLHSIHKDDVEIVAGSSGDME
jgi:uncharacterized protein YodC (DUF2158 family)